MSKVRKFMSKDGTVRIASVDSTELVTESIKYQGMSMLAACLCGRAQTGAVLLASQLKDKQKVGLYFKGNGPIGLIFAESNFEGESRVYCQNPKAVLPESADRAGLGIGEGMLEVVRTLPFQRDAFKGNVELVSGEVSEDIALYLKHSDQVPSIVGLACVPSETGIEVAGGYVLELMPGVTEETIQLVEKAASESPSLSKVLLSGGKAEEYLASYMSAIEFTELEHDYELKHVCSCSREKMINSVKMLGLEAIKEMIAENKKQEGACQFCGKSYDISLEDLEFLKAELSNEDVH